MRNTEPRPRLLERCAAAWRTYGDPRPHECTEPDGFHTGNHRCECGAEAQPIGMLAPPLPPAPVLHPSWPDGSPVLCGERVRCSDDRSGVVGQVTIRRRAVEVLLDEGRTVYRALSELVRVIDEATNG